jgi:GNAT superfamily N-acetyltransferase
VRSVYAMTDTHIRQLHQLYQGEWWTRGRSLEQTQRCVGGSQVCVGLVDANERLAAFARVVTDFTFKALIFDVIVDPAARSQGLGQRVIALIKGHDKLRDICHFELYCLPDLYGFYRKFGFSEDLGEIRLMRCVNFNASQPHCGHRSDKS